MEKLSLYAVGDIGIQQDKPESALAHVAPTLRQADIAFCQLERVLSERGVTPDAGRAHSRSSPDMVSALTYAGFHVVSFASNHTLDWGVDALLDTIDVLKRNGLAVIGVGKDIEEARKPLILERKGVKVAFLAYCSVHRPGYEATADKPGLVPMRAWSIYQPLEHQPGTPGVRILTFPDPGDLEALEEDIRRVRTLADVVVVSMHWGIHFERATIAMYQRRVGHAAINAGADLIIGHHAHILKGMEVYKGKVIVYSMCNFAMATTYERALHRRENIPGWREMHKAYDWELDPDYSGYAWPYDSRKSIVVKALIEDKKVARVSFLPVYINKDAEPEVLSRRNKRFEEVVSYMEKITESEGLGAKYHVDGNEVVIHGNT
jgi:poly-gamma-glutamate synthesis protein (capsule biosynthesis protein)